MKNNKENIVLIGFMGCGKTVIGENLAFKLNYNFIDSDKEIQKISGITINEIFKVHGESYFRQLESNAIKTICNLEKQVISTGGGTIKNEANVKALKRNGIILYLKSSPEHIYNNIKDDTSRPLLQCADMLGTIKKLLNERYNLYEMYCDIIIDVSNCTIEQIVKRIIKTI